MMNAQFLAAILAATAAATASETPLPPPEPLERLAPGLSATVLLRAGDRLDDGTTYQPQNDYTGFFPQGEGGRGFLLVGHELRYRSHEGGLGGRFTRLKVAGAKVLRGETWVGGMHNNCAGTQTPWKTILSGEENPHEYLPGKARMALTDRVSPGDTAAEVGWMYEIDPFEPNPARRTVRRQAMGRFSHESAAILGDAVYLTEDAYDGHFFKFVPDRSNDYSRGKLFAYQAGSKSWLPVGDVYNARPEATAAGATPYNRLEDLQVGPDGLIYLAETGNLAKGDTFGRILRFDPATGEMRTYLEGGPDAFAQADNLAFDDRGRLLICEDQFDANVARYGSNEVVRAAGGKVESLLAVRRDGEPSGPSRGPDGLLYLSVMAKANSALLAIRGL
ncbi:MAG: DUF839 domain-containing protein [Candidatus Sericytochromatia bacterium]|nr:DUF839 domain-containing protein [Candidatus Tanganyikabacteria bacterium]